MRASLWLLTLVLSSPAVAQPVVVRLGSHGMFGRVVFEFARQQPFTLERSANSTVLHFPGGGEIPDASGTARNITAVTGGGDIATLTTSPLARIKALDMGNRVVVDVFDPAPAKPQADRRSLASSSAPQSGPSAFHDRPEPAATPQLAETPAPQSAALPEPPRPVDIPSQTLNAAPPTTLALAVGQPALASNALGSGTVLPFDATTGAAAFQHGDEAWLVFDERRPIDLQGPEVDPLFAGATVELFPSATLIRLKGTDSRRLRLDRQPEGWLAQAIEKGQSGQTQMPSAGPSRLLFSSPQPGRVVVVPDRATGRNLLVGTLRALGPGVPAPVRTPEFTVLPSWQGFVVEPVSDRTMMRPLAQGFAVETGSDLSPSLENGPGLAAAAVLTRRFDFPSEPVATLLRRLQVQTQDQGQTPVRSRLKTREATAQTMLALGLGVEAQSLLRLAVSEDPQGEADPDVSGLLGIAAIVSGRPAEANGLEAAGLPPTDDVALWRAARMAALNRGSPEAAQAFSATVGLVLSYPPALQNRLLPIAAETMVAGGASTAADALLAKLPDEPLLAFARANRLEQKGDAKAALTLYDALAEGRDRLASARAASRAVFLRLASGSISAADAADALTRNIAKWRGDDRERELRLQTANVQADAGRWRDAFELLRATAQLFPSDAADINGRAANLFDRMMNAPEATAIAPLELVSLAEENADVIARSRSADLTPMLADKLIALDLPERAGPVLQRMIAASADSPNRALLGARLASMQLATGSAAAAAATLAATEHRDVSPALNEERELIKARLAATARDIAGAAAILQRVGTPPALELLATILSKDGDWRGAASALGNAAAQIVPRTGPLTPVQQDLILRLASAEAHVGDEGALNRLAGENASRMTGPRADMFRLLTSAPVTAVADLRRSGQELAMVHGLPVVMTAIGSR